MARYLINLTRPKVLFANEAAARIALEVAEELGAELKIVVFGKLPGVQSLDDILAAQDRKLVPEFRCTKLGSLDHPAAILFTSGSSGLPKGVQLSHKSFFENVLRFGTSNDELKSGTSMLFSPLSWISGIFAMFKGVIAPDTRIIYPEFVEESAFQLIEKFKARSRIFILLRTNERCAGVIIIMKLDDQVTWMLLGISTAFRLQTSPAKSNYDLSSVESVLVGGSMLSENRQRALAELFSGASVCQAYGINKSKILTHRQRIY